MFLKQNPKTEILQTQKVQSYMNMKSLVVKTQNIKESELFSDSQCTETHDNV